jgi:D-3-phosphoglycerate dehydrogenase
MKKRPLSNLAVKRISTSPYFKESFARLEKEAILSIAHGTQVLPLNSALPADILITNTHTVTEKIDQFDLLRCQLLIHPNSGYDNLGAAFVEKAPFPIIVGNPIRAQAVTNFILSALFSHHSALPSHKSWDDARKWDRALLSERSVLILGKGHIGSLLYKSLSPLAGVLQVYDPYQGPTELNLEGVDVVIAACSLNSENYHLINKEFLNQLKEDFLLINAARGQLINTDDLISVLKVRPKAFAYLDVFEEEPADFTIFNSLSNIALSSHIAGVYSGIDSVTARYVATVIGDFQTMDEKQFKEKYKSVLLQNRLKNGTLI